MEAMDTCIVIIIIKYFVALLSLSSNKYHQGIEIKNSKMKWTRTKHTMKLIWNKTIVVVFFFDI